MIRGFSQRFGDCPTQSNLSELGVMDVDLVIFDCDGVLIDSELISARMLIATLRDFGVTVDMPYVARHFLGRSYPTVLGQIRKEFGVALPVDFEDEYRERLLAAFRKDLRAMPGVAKVLDRLAGPSCIATSSSPKRVTRSLSLVGLQDRFGTSVFTASQVQHGKPAPDLFLFAAARMGAEPGRTLVIEDSLNGIRAARAAGMTVWRFTGGSHIAEADRSGPASDGAAFSFADFGEFFHHAPALAKPE